MNCFQIRLQIAALLAFLGIGYLGLWGQHLELASACEASGWASETAMGVDAQGNVWSAGHFQDSIDLDPGPSTAYYQTQYASMFVHKLDPQGNFLWGGAVLGAGGATPWAIQPIPGGKVLVVGQTSGVNDFDMGQGIASVGTLGGQGMFILCLDSLGQYLWTKYIDGIVGSVTYHSAAVDTLGNIFVSGRVGSDTVDFDPGPGVFPISAHFRKDIFLARYDAEGNLVWAEAFGGVEDEWLHAMSLSPTAIYLTGNFADHVDFDPGVGVHAFYNLVGGTFMAKYDWNGGLVWAMPMDSASASWTGMIQEDPQGNAVIAMQVQRDFDLIPGPGISMHHHPSWMIALIKLDPLGGYLWGKTLEGNDAIKLYDFAIDTAGGIYLVGEFPEQMDFDPGPGMYYGTPSTPGPNPSLVKLDPAGNLGWAIPFAAPGWVIADRMQFDAQNYLYLSGYCMNTCDLAPAPLDTFLHVPLYHDDPFFVKLRLDACQNLLLRIDSLSDIHCAAPIATMICSASGTTGPYTYVWNTLPPTENAVATTTAPGLYTVLTADGHGCTAQRTVLIHGPSVPSGFDWSAELVASPRFSPGLASDFRLLAHNDGCVPTSGQVSLVLDPQLTYQSAQPAPSSISGDTLTWSLPASGYDDPFFVADVHVTTALTASSGDTLACTAMALPVVGDANPLNNVRADYRYLVSSAMDPNMKSAHPAGSCVEQYVLDTLPLTYTIQFQNTGNAEALEVVILDTLSPYLDLYSLRIVAQSHAMQTEVLPGNVLRFAFHDIHLPDSSSNAPASHGYVTYEVLPQVGLASGTAVRNGSAIYFDFNPPVITNVVLHTLVDAIPACLVAAPEPQSHPENTMHLYPNPSSGIVTLSADRPLGEVAILNALGQVVWTQAHVHTSALNLDVHDWAKGIYFVRANGGVKRLVVE